MSAVDEYQTATENLAASAEREVLAVYADMLSGRIPPNTGTVLIAAAVNRANATAVSLADVWLAVQIEELAGQPVPTVGVLPVDSSERLLKAATTVLQTSQSAMFSDPSSNSRQESVTADQGTETENLANTPDMRRLERLARSEVFETAQQATHDAMQKQPLVEGWVRHMDADPCQLCRWWWRDGRIWPKAHPMPRHKGCNCQPKVVLAQDIQSTVFTRRLERNT